VAVRARDPLTATGGIDVDIAARPKRTPASQQVPDEPAQQHADREDQGDTVSSSVCEFVTDLR
jgi:hypothetical protein